MGSLQKIRLAIVDDDPLFLEQVSSVLARDQGMDVVSARSSGELFDALDRRVVDCVVLDYDLGTETGLGIGAELTTRIENPPPIIMLTGEGSERTAVKAFRSGFSDYVTKRNLHIGELSSAIRTAVERRREADAEDAQTDQLKSQLQIEAVTGLYSIPHVSTQIAELTNARVSCGFAIAALWLPDLPQIRSSLGNVMASRVLQEFARRLKDVAGNSATCAYGASEGFVCLITGPQAVADIAQMHDRLCSQLTFGVEIERTRVNLEPVVGTATFPADGETPKALLQAAQREMELDAAAGDDGSGEAIAGLNGRERTDANLVESLGERRLHRRQRVLKRGKIKISGTGAVIDCAVRNLSPLGARLRVDGYFAAPAKFDLIVVGAGAQPRPAELIWQSGAEMGVRFLGPVA